MNITNQVDVLIKGRTLMLKIIEELTLAQINKVPVEHKNNIGWNIAHLVVTQQLLCYKLSGLKTEISEDMIEKYRKGTKAENTIEKQEWEFIKEMFLALPKTLENDYDKGIFKSYSPYTTSVNVTLDSIEKAIDFNNFHEGIHLGILLGLKKLV